MEYNINEKILSIPPHISTSWESVTALHIQTNPDGKVLIINLKQSSPILIPNLDQEVIDLVFAAHAKFLSNPAPSTNTNTNQPFNQLFNMPGNASNFGLSLGGSLEGIGSAMQHNPDQANAPDLPKEIIEKIAGIAKVVGGDEMMNAPAPEPHCNCIHCQIAKAIHQTTTDNLDQDNQITEEEVSDEDLRFKTWDIIQKDNKIFMVINPLDNQEQYRVYLGEPIGCTCGEKNCEHIRAVLNS